MSIKHMTGGIALLPVQQLYSRILIWHVVILQRLQRHPWFHLTDSETTESIMARTRIRQWSKSFTHQELYLYCILLRKIKARHSVLTLTLSDRNIF